MKARRILVNSNCYHGYDVIRAIEGVHKLGYKNIELTATKGWTEHVFPSQSFSELLKVKNLLRAYSIDVPAMSGHCNLMDTDRLEDFKENIALASFFEAETIVSSIGEAHLKDMSKGGDEAVAENIASLIPNLKENGLRLSLETHGEHGTAARIKQIVEMIDSPLVGICYDTANVIFYGGIKGTSDLEGAVSKVNHIHIKDKKGEPTEWDFPALGEGYVDFPALLSALDKNNNDSPLSIEIEFTAKGSGCAEEVDEALKKSADYLLSLGYSL